MERKKARRPPIEEVIYENQSQKLSRHIHRPVSRSLDLRMPSQRYGFTVRKKPSDFVKICIRARAHSCRKSFIMYWALVPAYSNSACKCVFPQPLQPAVKVQ